jgi:hypothetical protein
MFSRRWFAVVCGLALAAATPCFGQDLNGSISGTVTDSSGAVIPGASVTILNPATNSVAYRGKTNESGVFLAPVLPVAQYDITIAAAGFKTQKLAGITLQVNQRVRADASLQTGELTETVTVTAEGGGQVEAESSSVGAIINTSQVNNLPLPSRNVLNLLTLIPGVSSGGAATGINANQMSINGSRTLNSEFTVDGVSVVSGSTGGLTRLPSTEAIREFKVLTSGYSAEYGRTSGGSVSMIVTSGTNQVHGGAYEYFRNETLNANNFFRNLRGEKRPSDRYNQFGGKLGGPVFIPKLYNGRDRTFFFVTYEELRRIVPFNQTTTIPDSAYRTGDFSASTVPVIDPLSALPFAGNRLPASRIDPAATKFLSYLPSPNSPGTFDASANRRINNNINSGATHPTSKEITSRVDHSLSSQARVYGRFTHYRNIDPATPDLPGPLSNQTGDSFTTGYQTSLGYTHTWTPTLISELNFGFMRDNPKIDPPSLGINVQSALGIERSTAAVTPVVSVSGWATMGVNSNTWRRQINNNYQWSGTLTKVAGGHVVKMGFQKRNNQFNVYNPGGNFAGFYNFTGSITNNQKNSGNAINSMADFLLGTVKTAGYDLSQPPTGRRNYNIGMFVQDDWKVTSRLTLNLGLRWEFESPMTIANGMYSQISPFTGKLLVANKNASATLNLVGAKKNFAPRLGLAYSLNPKTVIRSAFGMFYSQIFSNLGGVVPYPGFTVTQRYNDLGPGIAQPFTFRQGTPVVSSLNVDDPFFVERQATTANPLSGGAQFGQVNPMPYGEEWNLGIQREVSPGLIVDVSYVGTHGVHLPLSLPFNQVPFAIAEQVASVGTSAATQAARPWPTVGGFSAFMHAGGSNYHSLQAKGSRQFSRNFGFTANYTWSKSIDDGSGLFSFSQPSGLDQGQFVNQFRRLDRGLSQFDRRHNFAAALQFRTGGPKWFRGFEVDPILTARDGLMDTVNQNNLHPSATQQRPSVVGTNAGGYAPQRTNEGTAIRYLLSPNDPNFPFIPTGPLFTGSGATRKNVLPFQIGNLGRNMTRLPGELNLDLAMSRRIPLRERLTLMIRAEAFNILNHTNLDGPNAGLTVTSDPRTGAPIFNSPSFGLITSSKAARFMQLVARIEF